MNNLQANQLMQEFLDTMCPEKYRAAFVHCLETDDAKGAEALVDLITKEQTECL